jgi:hypothetical protein
VTELGTNNSTSHHQISPNHIEIPSLSILPFLKAFAQTHHLSQTAGANSIRSIPHHNLLVLM